MISTDKFGLLRDLARLVRKYGPTAFSELATFLREPESVAELVKILEAAEGAGRKARITEARVVPSGTKGGKGGVQNLLSEIERDQPEKAQIISGFYRALTDKRALPTMRELRSFAVDNGLKELSATSRDKAIGPVLRSLAELSLEDIRSILGRIRIEDAASDRTLEGWTNVILDKDRTRRI